MAEYAPASPATTSSYGEAILDTPATPDQGEQLTLSYEGATWKPVVLKIHHTELLALFAKFVGALSRSEDAEADEDTPSTYLPVTLASSFISYLRDHDISGEFLSIALDAFEADFLSDSDIHSLAVTLDRSTRSSFLKTYYSALQSAGKDASAARSALFDNGRSKDLSIYAICGGQGPSNAACLGEIRDLYNVYGAMIKPLIKVASEVLCDLATLPETANFYEAHGFDVQQWIDNIDTSPAEGRLASAPLSFPLIGLLSLVHYSIACKTLGRTPGDLRDSLRGITGHSQGIVAAAAIACSTTWDSFYASARHTMEILFWIGFECHHSMPFKPLSAAMVQAGIDAGEGTASPMLSVRGLDRPSIESLLAQVNFHVRSQDKIYVALINSRENMVIAGPPKSLHALNIILRKMKASDEQDQSRVVFNKRKPVVKHDFLPISAAFHSPYSADATKAILKKLGSRSMCGNDLGVSLYHTETGEDLKNYGSRDIIEALIKMITTDLVDWPKVSVLPDASHVLDFGPGRLGTLIQKSTEGTGVRIILASDLVSPSKNVGGKAEMFSSSMPPSIPNWGEKFRPRLVKNTQGVAKLDTKMSRLLGVPPVMVAGMTPTTVPWDVVAAVMEAGYHIELAGGGYFSADALEAAIIKLSENISPKCGITINIIYASPRAVAWQIPLIRQLVQRGCPIDGLTVGAGVPSTDVVKEYIETLGLKHISFKPGSEDAIMKVIAIAKAHPNFPIGLQWTGGRGGGHHSFEDFHAPILEVYGEIRSCDNIVLVAGSGFGGADDTYPYLTGEWSQSMGYPLMPFDGVLLGSRMMVSKEAHTSPQAKELIVKCEGTGDCDWHTSYKKATGGIITVNSEMGQPIHKVATRGVMLWSELDKKIFSILDKTKRLAALQSRRAEIIEKLNKDSQKPWFPIDSFGTSVDIDDMTYLEILQRMVSLMYVKHQKRWIDPSFRKFVFDFTVRTKARLRGTFDLGELSLNEPEKFICCLQQAIPSVFTELVHPEDSSYFMGLCNRRGQKPINFIPRFDDKFETWFKKDSLWQAEDIDAVIDQDAQRVCIIHGPVAARHATIVDEPAKSILDGIATAHVEMLQKNYDWNRDQASEIQLVSQADPSDRVEDFVVESTPTKKVYLFPAIGDIPDIETFSTHVCNNVTGWAHACFSDKTILQGQDRRPNPIRSAFTPCHGYSVTIEYNIEGQAKSICTSHQASTRGASKPSFRVVKEGEQVLATLSNFGLYASSGTCLTFSFGFSSERAFCKLHENMASRNERIKEIYAGLWLETKTGGVQKVIIGEADVNDVFDGEPVTLTRRSVQSFMEAVCCSDSISGFLESVEDIVPLDICIMVAWKALIKPLLIGAIDGDLLRLLHRSNEFRYIGDASPLRIGDVLESSSRVNAVTISKAGKSVEVVARITREGSPVVEVTSTFFYQGIFTDFEATFRNSKEPEFAFDIKTEVEQILLTSREWAAITCHPAELVGTKLIFDLSTQVTFDSQGHYTSLHVSGNIFAEKYAVLTLVGTVYFERGNCHGNPVIDFLERHGYAVQKHNPLQQAGWEGKSSWTVQMPQQAVAYSRASLDVNPIHLCPVFAHYAQLPGLVTHGMYTSAVVRRVIEKAAAEADLSRFRRYSASFDGMVFPGDDIRIELQHTAMTEGRMILKIRAFNAETDDKVLEAEAEIEQARTAYIFTGQGSQEKNMGMALYESSAAARALWDSADKELLELYGKLAPSLPNLHMLTYPGFSIINIVRNDPKALTVHFGGARGRKIRDNYLAMTIEKIQPDGSSEAVPIISGLKPTASSYTFSDSRGLLYSTQFAQPALTLMEMAAFEDVKARGLVQKTASFAGHSLGEYSALGALGRVIPMESLVSLVFYRGLTMQVAMERDAHGQTEYSMVAANPSRVGRTFSQAIFQSVVEMIASETSVLLEIVNFNVQERQYVCAGHLRALWIMGHVLTTLSRTASYDTASLLSVIKAQVALSHDLPIPIQLERGEATIPLKGIDVPFHSTHLRHGIEPYRRYLETKILEENVVVENLVGKFVPNVLAKPFSVDREYVEEAARTMNSERLRKELENWVEVEA